MGYARNIVLYLSFAILIIGVHQSITLGFEVSYWIFMITISLYLLYRLMGQAESSRDSKKVAKSESRRKSEKDKKKQAKTEPTGGKGIMGKFNFLRSNKSKNQPKLNRRAKRYLEKTQGTGS